MTQLTPTPKEESEFIGHCSVGAVHSMIRFLDKYPSLAYNTEAIFATVENDAYNALHLLVVKGAEVNVLNEQGQTPLMVAAQSRSRFTLDALLFRYNAAVEVSDTQGRVIDDYMHAPNMPHYYPQWMELAHREREKEYNRKLREITMGGRLVLQKPVKSTPKPKL